MQYHMHLTRLIFHINNKSTSELCVCLCMDSVMSDSLWPHGLWPAKILCLWDFSSKNTGNGLPFTPPGDLLYPGICIAGGYLTNEPWGRHSIWNIKLVKNKEQCCHSAHNPSTLICLHHQFHAKGYFLLGSLISPTLQIGDLKRQG